MPFDCGSRAPAFENSGKIQRCLSEAKSKIREFRQLTIKHEQFVEFQN